MKKHFLFFVFVCFYFVSEAQYFQTGQDPASLKWRQINTANFQLVYPDYYEIQAQRLAAIMEMVYTKAGTTLHYQPRKISIVLHTQTVSSNGLVAWAPKRVELYTIPHQGIYAQDWLEQLAIHEFRHVVQIGKIASELPKIIRILLGEQGEALVFGSYVPWWYIEGDAVVAETAFSNSGRGRFPSFLMEHKALAVEKGNYKYDKAYNSSFKDFVPDHYKLGYYLVGATREKYGAELWNSVLDRVGKKPFSINPFNRALKEKTGLNKVELYNMVFDSLQKVWIAEDEIYQQTKIKIISPQNKIYTNYIYNHRVNNSEIISYKTALNKIPSFVQINKNGDEKIIHQPGTIFNESVNFRDEWIVWSEKIPDPRWQHSGESHIQLLNTVTNKKFRIKPEFTAFAPAISPDKKKIVVVESDFSNRYYLSVYRIEDGELLSRFQTKNNNYFFSPDWLNEMELVAVVLFNKGKRLVKINPESGKKEILVEKDLGEIKSLKVVNKSLYFVCSYSGKNSLYQLELESKRIERIYEPRFDLDYPAVSPDAKSIILSDYTSEGYRLIQLEKKDLVKVPVGDIQKEKYFLAAEMKKQEPEIFDFSALDTTVYNSEKYYKTQHLFNFHSWAPLAVDVEAYEFSPGMSVLSQNILGTASLNVGYKWKTAEKTGEIYGKYTFKGWYPLFDLYFSTGKSASEYNSIEQVKDKSGNIVHQDTTLNRFTWNKTNFGADIRVPLDFSSGKFIRYLQPEIKFDYTFYGHDGSTPERYFEGDFQPLTYRLYYQQLLRKSYQDVFPNFGFIADVVYKHTPIGKTDLGGLFLGQSIIYLPGLISNHGIKFYSGIQDKNLSSDYSFSELIRYPRGYGKINTTRTYSLSGDYKMPLFYPEWSVGNLVYLQRVKASLFADFAILNGNIYDDGMISGTFHKNISSFGIELTGDMNFLRFYAPIEMGTRASYLPEFKRVYFDFLLSIDFNSL